MARDPLADAKGVLASADAYAARTGAPAQAAAAKRLAARTPKRATRTPSLSEQDQAWGQPRSLGDNISVRDQLLGRPARKKKRASARSANGR